MSETSPEKNAVAAKLRSIAEQQVQEEESHHPSTAEKLSSIVAGQETQEKSEVAATLREITRSTLEAENIPVAAEPSTQTKSNRETKTDGNDEKDEEGEYSSDEDAAVEEDDTREALSDETGTQFIRAAQRGDSRELERILNDSDGTELSPNFQDRHGWSALHIAASSGHDKVCKMLLGARTNPNAQENLSGWTPLHLAAIKERYKISKMLIDHGAKRTIRDKQGDVPYDCIPPPRKQAGGESSELVNKLRELLQPKPGKI